MIGLGSNRLSVCRRGGMRVTQAGRGGMEWLAGGRRPRWSSPYSAQATAALLAQFPTQWPTIRDYGFAHPEIVPIVNAYYPTYPEMIEQVCWLGFKHGIKGDGRALIDTNFVVGANDEIEIEYWGTSQSGDVQSEYVIGAGNSSFGDGFTIARQQGSGYFGGASFMTNIPDFTKGIVKLEMSASKIVRYWNDVKVDEIDITPTGYTGQYLRFFGLKRQNSTLFDTTYLFTGIIYHIYIKRNGEYKYLLIPRTVNGNNGFVNMVNGSMVYRTNSNGAFSLVETTSLT